MVVKQAARRWWSSWVLQVTGAATGASDSSRGLRAGATTHRRAHVHLRGIALLSGSETPLMWSPERDNEGRVVRACAGAYRACFVDRPPISV